MADSIAFASLTIAFSLRLPATLQSLRRPATTLGTGECFLVNGKHRAGRESRSVAEAVAEVTGPKKRKHSRAPRLQRERTGSWSAARGVPPVPWLKWNESGSFCRCERHEHSALSRRWRVTPTR